MKTKVKLINKVIHLINALSILSGKWKIKIIEKLSYGEMRFGELKKSLNIITSQSAIQRIKGIWKSIH